MSAAPASTRTRPAASRGAATLDGLALERILVPGRPDPAPDLARLTRQGTRLLGGDEAEETET